MQLMTAATQAVPQLGPVATCAALGVSRASLHRLQNPPAQLPEPMQRPSPPRALTAQERCVVLSHLHSERFQDRSPTEVYGTLLDEGVYCCSARTMRNPVAGRYRRTQACTVCSKRRARRANAATSVGRLLADRESKELLAKGASVFLRTRSDPESPADTSGF